MAFSDQVIRFGSLSGVTSSRGANDPQLGDRASDGTRDYVYVYAADAISTGLACYALGVGYTVSVGTTANVDYPVGWCQHTTLTTGTYGWVATRGIINVQMGTTASAASGALLAMGANGAMIGTQYSGATATIQGPAIARAMSNIVSNTSGYAYVR